MTAPRAAQMSTPARANDLRNAYDAVPYEAWSYAHTHPDVLATVATLRGLTPAPVASCRVLEIGCATGRNLLPLALSLPGSEFVGIDASTRQIDRARRIQQAVGAANVAFHHMDLRDWDASLGRFDYIIAHGVYSWVAEPVRRALLELCQAALQPQGAAYISYNTYPGWHMLEAMRHMMGYHIQHIQEPGEQARQARALIEWLAAHAGAPNLAHSSFSSAYQHLLQGYFHGVLDLPGRNDSLFLHDELEEVNEPCYFHQFRAALDAHGLAYLGDAEFDSDLATGLPEGGGAALQEVMQPGLDPAQYLDFLRNRSFRRSLVCRHDAQPDPAIDLARLDGLWFASRASIQLDPAAARPNGPAASPDVPDHQSVRIAASNGVSIPVDHPLTIVAFDELRTVWPARRTLDQLLDAAYDRLLETNPHLGGELGGARQGRDPARRNGDRRRVAQAFLEAFCTSAGLIQLHTESGAFTTQIEERPLASVWARWEATERTTVTNLAHQRVALEPLDRFLLARLDGEHSRAQLVAAVLADPAGAGVGRLEDPDQPGQPAASLHDAATRLVEQALARLAGNGLIVERKA